MEYKDYYKTMGVGRDAGPDEIKRAYRKLARKFHPDVSKEPDAEARFKEVGEAYEVLKDPEKRAAYDQLGANWKAGQEFHPPPDWNAGFEFSGGGFTGGDASAFSDFFESLFGRECAGKPSAGGHIHARGQDHHAKVLIDLDDAYHGAARTLTLQAPELDDQGRVRMYERTLNARIPKGIKQGQRRRSISLVRPWCWNCWTRSTPYAPICGCWTGNMPNRIGRSNRERFPSYCLPPLRRGKPDTGGPPG